MIANKQLNVKSKKIILLLFILTFTIYFFSSCAEKKSRREFVIEESKSYEASLYRQHCSICHGKEGNGKEMADGSIVPTLRYGKAAQKTEAEVYDQIKNGKLPMPSFKNQLSEEDIQKMVKFVMRDLQGREEK